MGKCSSPPKKKHVTFSLPPCRFHSDNSRKVELPVITRLTTYRREDPFQSIKSTLELKQALPVGSLPRWNIMPLDDKIPGIRSPEGAVTLTRGKLAQPLEVKKHPFTLRDPYNRHHTVDNTYDALHDPHAAAFIKQRVTQKLLWERELIDENGQVLCDLKQFNRYREYLHNIYCETLNEHIRQQYEQEKHELASNKELSGLDMKRERSRRAMLAEERRIAASERRRAAWEEMFTKVEGKKNREARTLECHTQIKIQKQIMKAILSRQRQIMHQRRHQAIQEEIRRNRNVETLVEKEIDSQRRFDDEKDTHSSMHKYYIAEWLLTKWKDQERRIDREEQVREGIDFFLEDKAVERRRRMELQTRNIREMGQRKKDEIARQVALLRKYFNLWLSKVRKVREDRKIEHQTWHQSCWDTRSVLQNMVTELRIQTNRGEAKFVHLVNFMVTRVKEATAQGKQEEKRKSKGYMVEGNEEDEGDEEVAKDVEKEPVMNPDEILHTASVEEKLLATRNPKSNLPKAPAMSESKQNTQYISKKLARYAKNRPSLTQQRKAKGLPAKSKGATKKKIMSMSNRNPLLEKFNDK